MKSPDEILKEVKNNAAEAAKLSQQVKQADLAKQRGDKLQSTLKAAQAVLKDVQD